MQFPPAPARLSAILVVALVAASCQADGDEVTTEPDDTIDQPSDPTTPDAAARPTTGPPDRTETTDAADVLATTPSTVDKQVVTPTIVATETVYEVGLVDRGLAPFVTQATDDLAGRLGVAPDDVELLTAVIVVWPDASLGCPEPGMSYAQVATDGSVIELGVGERVYRYHSGGSSSPFLCERALDRPPTPIAVPESD